MEKCIHFFPLGLAFLNIMLASVNIYFISQLITQNKATADLDSMHSLRFVTLGTILESADISCILEKIIEPTPLGIASDILKFIYYIGKCLHTYGLIQYLHALNKIASYVVGNRAVPSPLVCITPQKHRKHYWSIYYIVFITFAIIVFIAEEVTNKYKDYDAFHGAVNELFSVWGIIYQIIAYRHFQKAYSALKYTQIREINLLNQILIGLGIGIEIPVAVFDVSCFVRFNIEEIWYAHTVLYSVINGCNVAICFVIYQLYMKVAQFVQKPVEKQAAQPYDGYQ